MEISIFSEIITSFDNFSEYVDQVVNKLVKFYQTYI